MLDLTADAALEPWEVVAQAAEALGCTCGPELGMQIAAGEPQPGHARSFHAVAVHRQFCPALVAAGGPDRLNT